LAQHAEDIEFAEDDLSGVVARMDELAVAGTGWVNLLPEVEAGANVPPSGGFLALFSARGPSVPLGTWTAGTSSADGPGRASVGVQHGSGPKALDRLRELGLALPAGWQRVQDHPRRGLVATVPAGADRSEVLHWLLSSMHALANVRLTGNWLAQLYRGR